MDHAIKSIQDNRSFSILAEGDELKVMVDSGKVTMQTKPANLLNANSNIKATAGNGLIAARAIFNQYPAATSVHIDMLGDFTDQTGHSMTESAATMDITRETASHFDYNGLNDLVLTKPSTMFCDADSYDIHPAVWKDLDDGDKGCMTDSSK